MAEKITKDMNIMDIIALDNGLAGVFMESGMGCLGCAAAHFENLAQACAAHHINADELQAKLNAYLEQKS